MKSTGVSRLGLIRKTNEDSIYNKVPLFVVADGMGGHIGGEIASALAISIVAERIRKSDEISESTLEDAIQVASREICKRATHAQDLAGMGTTVVIAYAINNELIWANVGDSRLYIIRNGIISQITTDHSMVHELIELGKLSKEEAATHPQRNVLMRAVGISDKVEVDTGRLTLLLGDRLLLCSDGLTNCVSDEEILAAFAKYKTDKRVIDTLLSLVYERGAKDNVSIIVATV